jgi:FkbM family methyltransferase
MIYHGIWESGCTRVWESIINIDSCVVDVGANFGYYTLVAANKAFNGSIYSFEANPRLASYIRDSVDSNSMRLRTTVESLAVSDTIQKFTMKANSKFTINGTINETHREGRYAPDCEWDVQSTTIDEYFKGKKVDVIKIDVEGQEKNVYDGAKETLKGNVKVLIEFEPPRYENPEVFFNQFLKDFQYVYLVQLTDLFRLTSFADWRMKIKNNYSMLLLSKVPV